MLKGTVAVLLLVIGMTSEVQRARGYAYSKNTQHPFQQPFSTRYSKPDVAVWAVPAGANLSNKRICCDRSNGGSEPSP
ncbi:hypothetical protein So717_01160 [Roseobacter cerasinus]|uniref:Uncharacterized protein n=1 Tax=Roseobacter cerasinus TaxID=2602289 RepID=A0A640VJ50_9RHOB|nr:hypothetical protein So717_01160 [Roseobacter cerasinus]